MNFCDLVNNFLQVKEDYRKEIFAIMAWSLWNRRNAIRFGRTTQPLSHILSSAGNLLQEFLAAQEEIPTEPRSAVQIASKLILTLLSSRLLTRLGLALSFGTGKARLLQLSIPIPLSNSVADMEALACRRAIQFAAELGLQRVIFEGDSAIVINNISLGNAALSSFGNIVDDICSLVSSFKFSDFIHVHRACNFVADALAKKAKNLMGSQVWLDVMPEDITPLIGFDVH